MRATKTPVAFISAHDSTLPSTDNRIRHERLKNELATQGVPVISDVFGQYKGETEMSLLVSIRNGYDMEKVMLVARFFKQESILFCDNEGNGSILYIQGGPNLHLGQYSISTKPPVDKDFSYIRENESFMSFGGTIC